MAKEGALPKSTRKECKIPSCDDAAAVKRFFALARSKIRRKVTRKPNGRIGSIKGDASSRGFGRAGHSTRTGAASQTQQQFSIQHPHDPRHSPITGWHGRAYQLVLTEHNG